MQSVNLTDDQLWRAIAQNTNAMTALIHQQLELAAVTTISDSIRQAKLRESNAESRASSPLFFGINSTPRRAQQTLHQLQSATLNEQNAWSRC